MILNNTLIIKGEYQMVSQVYHEVYQLLDKKTAEQAALYEPKLYKKIKDLEVDTISYHNNEPFIKVRFAFKGSNVKAFIDLLNQFSVEVLSFTEQAKGQVWITNPISAITEYQLIPEWAIEKILIDYMYYIESNIILDSYETIQVDRNTNKIVINNLKPVNGELLNLFFTKKIKGKFVYALLETFTNSYYQTVINKYELLYSSNKEKIDREEPTPLALFIVTFGIFAIIAIFLYGMGYL